MAAKKPFSLRRAAAARRELISQFRESPSTKQIIEVFNDFLRNPKRYEGAIHPLEPSRHAYRFPVGKRKYIAIKVATPKHNPKHQFQAIEATNYALSKAKPKTFVFKPFKLYFATESFLGTEVINGVSMQALYDWINDMVDKKTRQAGHFLKRYPNIKRQVLDDIWTEANSMIVEIGKREDFRPDTEPRNIMIRGISRGRPIVTLIDQG